MCGVPIERADDYLQRLIALGHRVAVCEQLEDPAEAKKRGAKSVVRRDVVRLVTPGTITEERLLEPGRANVLVADPAREGRGAARVVRPRGARYLDRRLLARARPTRPASPSRSRGSSRARSSRRRACSTIPSFARLVAETRDRRRRRSGARRRTACARSGGSANSMASRRSTASAPSRAPKSRAAALALAYVERTQIDARPAPCAAVAPRARRKPGDRRRDARQSRTDAHACRASARARCSATIDLTQDVRPARGCSPSGWRAR